MISFSTKSRTTRYKQFPFLRGFRCQISRNRKSWFFFHRLAMSSSLSLIALLSAITNAAFLCRCARFFFLVFCKVCYILCYGFFCRSVINYWKTFLADAKCVFMWCILLIGREFALHKPTSLHHNKLVL